MKNAVITGASRGLGLEIAKKMLKEEWNIYCINRTTTPELQNLVESNNNRVKILNFDLADTQLIKDQVFKQFISNKTPIHACIHNSAIAYDDILTNANFNKLDEMYRVNVMSVIMLNKYLIRNMLYNRIKGSIVHISSISATTGFKGLSMYASTKGAVEALSNNIAREWGSVGIRSNCVVPGFMETSMSSGLSQEQKNKIYNRTSLRESTDISSVCNTVHFLCEDISHSITGQKIHVDGGVI